jgi:hypothetical protein
MMRPARDTRIRVNKLHFHPLPSAGHLLHMTGIVLQPPEMIRDDGKQRVQLYVYELYSPHTKVLR